MVRRHFPEQVLARFPGLRDRVGALYRSDAVFAEICTEYEEVCRTLEPTHGDSPVNSAIADELRRLREDLAADLAEALADARVDAETPVARNEPYQL